MTGQGVVFAVDDDPSMRDLIEATIRNAGLEIRTFGSAEELIQARNTGLKDDGGCVLLLDLELPGTTGLQLLEEMRRQESSGAPWPVIVVTARASVSSAVRSMKLGVVDFLEKPFEPEQLISLVKESLEKHRAAIKAAIERAQVIEQLGKLSPRERELLDAIVNGESTKMIADRLGISARTVDHHRANLMEKMKAENVADLVRKAMTADYKRVVSGGA